VPGFQPIAKPSLAVAKPAISTFAFTAIASASVHHLLEGQQEPAKLAHVPIHGWSRPQLQ
jgi:hypothetical protein